MSASARRRRGVLLLLDAVLAGSMAASRVRGEERAIRAQVGPLVPVVVARGAIPARARMAASAISETLAIAHIPSRFVPAGALRDPTRTVGATSAVDIPRGGYLTKAMFASARDPR